MTQFQGYKIATGYGKVVWGDLTRRVRAYVSSEKDEKEKCFFRYGTYGTAPNLSLQSPSVSDD